MLTTNTRETIAKGNLTKSLYVDTFPGLVVVDILLDPELLTVRSRGLAMLYRVRSIEVSCKGKTK